TPNPVVIKKGGDNKLHIDVSWEGLAIGEKDKVVTKLTCFSTAVTIKDSPQNHLYSDGKATYEVTVNEKGKLYKFRVVQLSGKVQRKDEEPLYDPNSLEVMRSIPGTPL
ncbi:1910_t:CDS:2, partial [Funneliformis caledonium]